MKTKIIWEESDIKPGLRARNINTNIEVIVGYYSYIEDGAGLAYGLLYTHDWYITPERTKQQVADLLNIGSWVPANYGSASK